jgi:hypothetical protein
LFATGNLLWVGELRFVEVAVQPPRLALAPPGVGLHQDAAVPGYMQMSEAVAVLVVAGVAAGTVDVEDPFVFRVCFSLTSDGVPQLTYGQVATRLDDPGVTAMTLVDGVPAAKTH